MIMNGKKKNAKKKRRKIRGNTEDKWIKQNWRKRGKRKKERKKWTESGEVGNLITLSDLSIHFFKEEDKNEDERLKKGEMERRNEIIIKSNKSNVDKGVNG